MQPQIKAIETVYKGFRFRSRLEARWAVFFDEMGKRWEYEHQGFDLDGERYLPDFWLPDDGLFVEVKPGPRPAYHPPLVYMAGRMVAPTKGAVGHCYRPFSVHCVSAAGTTGGFQGVREIEGVRITYVGPFTSGVGNHCDVHGVAGDGYGEEEFVFKRALDAIDRCDVFFAMLEDLQAFGTISEIGYAYALNKPIIIGLSGAVLPTNYANWETDEPATGKIAHPFADHDLWFCIRMARHIYAGTREQVLGHFAQQIVKDYEEPREQRLIRKLAAGQGMACIVYGDPVDAFQSGGKNIFQPHGQPVASWIGDTLLDQAATAARQARFEHGQMGAR